VILVIQSSGDPRREILRRAFEALHGAQIRVVGGGRFSDGSGYVVLACDADLPDALAALDKAGIVASELKPRTKPETPISATRPHSQ
jgi:hypothetical protein